MGVRFSVCAIYSTLHGFFPFLTASTNAATVTLITTTNTFTMATGLGTKDPSVSMASVALPTPAAVSSATVTSSATSAIYATVTSRSPVVTSAIYASVTPRTSRATPMTSGLTPVNSTSLATAAMTTDTRIKVEAVIHRDTGYQRPASAYEHDLTTLSSSSRSRPQSSASSSFDPTYATIADLDLDTAHKVTAATTEGQEFFACCTRVAERRR